MPLARDIAGVQQWISNPLDPSAIREKAIAGIIGDGPSHYSKSPALWNAAFRYFGMNAIYLPFDVVDARVGELLRTLRDSESFMGVNVTVPHKVRVIDFLDEVDPGAARIQAINTVVRTSEGKLIGYNTDGEGFIDSLLLPLPGRREAFMKSLDGSDILLLGAGGSARALAFHVGDQIGKGKLIIANRTLAHARSLAGEIQKAGCEAIAIDEANVSGWAKGVELIVNSTIKGQGGIRKLSDGTSTILEPYSALAPANPPALANVEDSEFERRWRVSARLDIEANNRASEALAKSIPRNAGFYDLIYHPEETVFLRHGRLTGHKTMNGKQMIVCQAVLAFCKRICQRQLSKLNKNNEATCREVADVMYRAW